MKIFKRFAVATVSTAALSLAMISPSFAAPADPSGPEASSASSCVSDTIGVAHPFTCNIYETNSDGLPSEDTGKITLPAIVTPGWIVLLETGTDQSTSNWSDIIQFSSTTDIGQIEMWSDPETGFDPALIALVTSPFFITENSSGVTSYFSGGTQGVDNDYFFHSDADVTTTPEPLTLSVFGAGLAGAAALRRRKRKPA